MWGGDEEHGEGEGGKGRRFTGWDGVEEGMMG